MDERSSVSLLCLVKGEGELKARGMEVEKDLYRKEKIARAKALLEEGEWKELGEGRKMRRKMADFSTLSKWWKNRESLENDLIPLGMPKKWFYHHKTTEDWDSFLLDVDREAYDQCLTKDEVLRRIYDKVITFPQRYGSDYVANHRQLRTFTGTDESSKLRKSGKLELTYTVTGEPKPFDKQVNLDNLKSMKAMAEGMKMPFLYQPQLDQLEKEKKAWDAKYNSQLKLDKAKSSNIVDFYTKIGNLIDNSKKAAGKVSELTPALDMSSEDVIEPLKAGTQEDKDNAKKYEYALSVYRKYVQACKEFEKAIDKLENPLIIDAGKDL